MKMYYFADVSFEFTISIFSLNVHVTSYQPFCVTYLISLYEPINILLLNKDEIIFVCEYSISTMTISIYISQLLAIYVTSQE